MELPTRFILTHLPNLDALTKRQLVSDVAMVLDALGSFDPTTVKMKILLQHVWNLR